MPYVSSLFFTFVLKINKNIFKILALAVGFIWDGRRLGLYSLNYNPAGKGKIQCRSFRVCWEGSDWETGNQTWWWWINVAGLVLWSQAHLHGQRISMAAWVTATLQRHILLVSLQALIRCNCIAHKGTMALPPKGAAKACKVPSLSLSYSPCLCLFHRSPRLPL